MTATGYTSPRTWADVWLELHCARQNVASIVGSLMWRQLDRGQRRAIGALLGEMRRVSAALGDA